MSNSKRTLLKLIGNLNSMSNWIYIIKALVKRGPAFILVYIKESLAFDLRHGMNTHLRVPKVEPVQASNERRDGVLYVASLTSVIHRTLAAAKTVLGDKEFGKAQFFDLGCGKGKTLLVYAMTYAGSSQAKAVGIEYEPALCEIARRNVGKLKAVAGEVEVFCDSAVNLESYVQCDTLIVYLYNPFQGATLRAVLGKIARFRHVLIYVDPVEKDILAEYGYVIQATQEGRHHASTWLVALHAAPAAPVAAGSD